VKLKEYNINLLIIFTPPHTIWRVWSWDPLGLWSWLLWWMSMLMLTQLLWIYHWQVIRTRCHTFSCTAITRYWQWNLLFGQQKQVVIVIHLIITVHMQRYKKLWEREEICKEIRTENNKNSTEWKWETKFLDSDMQIFYLEVLANINSHNLPEQRNFFLDSCYSNFI
jgi:hypothetical protein